MNPAGLILQRLDALSRGPEKPPERPRFARDEHVTVTDGLNKGRDGIIRSRGSVMFGSEPTWVVDFGGLLGLRTIRQDFLRSRRG